jgi:two-component system CheB/CheR fusion protein
MRYLENHPEEYQRLVSSFLIKVTEFFRDPELFVELQERVLPDLIAEARKRGNVLRIWSAGCATGEEAYSLAILVAEALGDELDDFTVHLFATDVDEDAIEFARHGVYPTVALKGVSQMRRARYFLRLDGNIQVSKTLRGLIIFGVHDLGLRAPFPHIDLVVCRNVLMYFTRELQARALQLFAFSLRDGGYLALGTAETVSPLADFYEQLDPDLKVFRRRGTRILAPMPTIESLQELVTTVPQQHHRALARVSEHGPVAMKRPGIVEATPKSARSISDRLGLLMLGLPLGVVVVNRRYDIQIINGTAMRMLSVYTEPIGEDLVHLAETVPSMELRAVIDAAFRMGRKPAEPSGPSAATTALPSPVAPGEPHEPHEHLEHVVTVETLFGEPHNLEITCYPYRSPGPVPPVVQDVVAQNQELTPPAAAASGKEVAPEVSPSADVPLVLLLIRDVTEAERMRTQESRAAADQQAAQTRKQTETDTTVERLQSEIARLKAEVERHSGINRALLEGNQKLAEVNVALRASNENLQLTAEETEASSEEVKTLNEELQASNEELVTLNEELEATVEELHASNAELEARSRELQELAAKVEVPQPQPQNPTE